MADERLASPRAASMAAASALTDSPRSAAMRRRRRQNASSSEMLVRCPAMTSERLTTRAFSLSVLAIRLIEAPRVEAGLRKRPLALDEALLGLRAAKDSAILSGFRLLALALLQFS